MKLVSVTCPACGGGISLDSSKKTGFCMYCGQKIAVQDAIKKSEIANLPTIQNYIILANRAFDDGLYFEAEKYYDKIIELQTEDYQILFKKALSVGYQATIGRNSLKASLKLSKRAQTIMEEQISSPEERAEIKKEWADQIYDMVADVRNRLIKLFGNTQKTLTSIREYWDVQKSAMYMSMHAEKLLEDPILKNDEKAQDTYLYIKKQLVRTYVELCRRHAYYTGTTNLASYFRIDEEDHKKLLAYYDNDVAYIKKRESGYKPPKIDKIKRFLWF